MIRRNPDKSSWRRDERPKRVSHGEKPYPVSRIPSAKNLWVRAFGKTSFPDEAERQTKRKIKFQQPTNFSFTLSKFRLLWQTAFYCIYIRLVECALCLAVFIWDLMFGFVPCQCAAFFRPTVLSFWYGRFLNLDSAVARVLFYRRDAIHICW